MSLGALLAQLVPTRPPARAPRRHPATSVQQVTINRALASKLWPVHPANLASLLKTRTLLVLVPDLAILVLQQQVWALLLVPSATSATLDTFQQMEQQVAWLVLLARLRPTLTAAQRALARLTFTLRPAAPLLLVLQALAANRARAGGTQIRQQSRCLVLRGLTLPARMVPLQVLRAGARWPARR